MVFAAFGRTSVRPWSVEAGQPHATRVVVGAEREIQEVPPIRQERRIHLSQLRHWPCPTRARARRRLPRPALCRSGRSAAGPQRESRHPRPSVPPAAQTAVSPDGRSHTGIAGPPSTAIFLTLLSATDWNATKRPSGDQNGARGPVAPSSGRGASSSSVAEPELAAAVGAGRHVGEVPAIGRQRHALRRVETGAAIPRRHDRQPLHRGDCRRRPARSGAGEERDRCGCGDRDARDGRDRAPPIARPTRSAPPGARPVAHPPPTATRPGGRGRSAIGRPGLFARHRATRRSRAGGTRGCSADTGGGSSRRMAPISPACVVPANGLRPVSISYNTAPKAKRSLRASTPTPSICSGDMYCRVPSSEPSVVSGADRVMSTLVPAAPASAAITLARPKSSSLACDAPDVVFADRASMMLPGFRSRWTMP